MILKALYDYYHKCKDNLPLYGTEYKEIGFIIVIDKDGHFKRLEDRRVDKKQAQRFLVKKSVGRTSAPIPNHLYDNSAYVLGYSPKDDSGKCIKVFKDKVAEIYKAYPENPSIKALYLFYQNFNNAALLQIQQDPLWEDVAKNLNKKYSVFSFLLEGETEIIACKKNLMKLPDNSTEKDTLQKMVCLITGEKSCVVETTTATMIPGSQATAKLVSFQCDSGYDSYGKTKGYNAPISEEAEFAYTTALNYLLRSDSKNKFLLGNRTFLFWASGSSESGQKAEESLWSMLGFQENDDDPNRRILQVREVFNSIYSGQLTTSLEDKFYIIGLAPNSARIAVSYWAEIPLKEFASMILKHFYDMDIIDTRKEKKPYFGLRSILSSVTLGGKVSDVTPNLPEALVKSIFQGLPYPQTLYSSCIRRIRAENTLGIARAAIIKAYLNRVNENQEKLNTMLDKENKNQGYLCGRLFAVLDKIQGDANGQHSIKERYMNAASATPATVFATIINLSSHHSEKLNEARKVYFEKLKQEIVDKISAEGFPSHLDLQDQGRFFVGFYHQQQDFYIKKEELNNDHE